MLGHGPAVLFSTYARVIAELRGEPPTSAEDRIRVARALVERELEEEAVEHERLLRDDPEYRERHERFERLWGKPRRNTRVQEAYPVTWLRGKTCHTVAIWLTPAAPADLAKSLLTRPFQ